MALSLDGQPVPIVTACSGANGAVLVTTEGEVTATLVQEDGTALRYSDEGMIAETTDVTIEKVGESTVYRATLQSEDVPAVDVTLEVADTSDLEGCQSLTVRNSTVPTTAITCGGKIPPTDWLA